MGLLEQCFMEKSSGIIKSGQEWIDDGINAQALATSGLWVACACELDNPDNIQGKNALRNAVGYSQQIGLEELALFIMVLKLMKTPEGMKILGDIAVQGLRSMGQTMDSLAKASAANPVTAWANPYLLSILWERWHIVPSERMAEFRTGLSIISGVEVAEDVIKAVSGFRFVSIGETRNVAEEFPQNLDLGDRSEEYTYHYTGLGVGGPKPSAKKKKG